MSCNAINGIAMTDKYDVYTEIGDSGRDIVMACNHEVVSNLVQTRIQVEIDKSIWIENDGVDASLLQQQLRFVIRNTYGVSDTDFSGFVLTRRGIDLHYGTICFTVDCANSKECLAL